MVTTIYLKGYGYLDVAQDLPLPINYSLAEIKDISKRNSSFSKTIILPGTKNNNEILGFLFDVNLNYADASFQINRKVEATIIQNDEQVLNGWFKLLKINKLSPSDISFEENIEYEAVVFSNQAGIYDVIKDLNIDDINLSGYNHTLSISAITGSTTYNYRNAYKYIWHYTSDNKYKVSDFRPAVYMKTVWDYIFSEAGFTYTSDFLNAEPFTKLLMPANIKDLLISDEEAERRGMRVSFSPSYSVNNINTFTRQPRLLNTGFPSGLPTPNNRLFVQEACNLTDIYSLPINPTNFLPNNFLKLQFNDETTGINFDGAYDNYSTTFYWFQSPKTAQYEFEVNLAGTFTMTTNFPCYDFFQGVYQASTPYLDYQTNGGAPAFDIIMDVTKRDINNNITILESAKVFYQIPFSAGTITRPNGAQYQTKIYPAGSTSFNYTFNPQKFILNLTKDDRIEIRVRCLTYRTLLIRNIYPFVAPFTVTTQYQFTINDYNVSNSFWKVKALKNNLSSGDEVKLSSILPKKIKQAEFIKSIANMFNLYLIPDVNDEKNIIIKTRDEFYAEYANDPIDWTDKIQYNSNYSLTLLSELQNKTLNFTWKEPKDSVNTRFKEQVGFLYGQYRLNFDNDFLTGEQSITPMFEPTPLVKTLLPLGVEGNTFIVPYLIYGTDTQPKVLYDGGAISVSGYTIQDGDSGQTINYTLNYYNYAGHFDNPITPNFDLNWNVNELYFYNEVLPRVTQNNLYNLYWYDYINLISQSKLLTAEFNLNEYDIRSLNFAKPIWIRDSYWLLNRVIDYNATTNGLTKVELIKSIDVPKYEATNNTVVVPPILVDTQVQKPWLNNKGDLSFDNLNPGDTGNVNFGAMTLVYGRDNIIQYGSKSVRITGDENYISSNAINVDINGSGNTIGGSSNKISVYGNDNQIGAGCTNISLNNCDNIIVFAGVSNISLANVSNQYITKANTTYYTEYLLVDEGITINNSDVVDAGVDLTIPFKTFQVYADNLIDGGLDYTYLDGVEGSDVINGVIDGNRYDGQYFAEII